MSIVDVVKAVGLEEIPAAVLWDMDGTIMDSEREWGEFSELVVTAHGGVWDEADTAFVTGASTTDHAGRLAEAVYRGAGERLAATMLFGELTELMAAQVYPHARLLPGAGELLTAFRAAGVAQALVTATPKPLVDIALRALPEPYFNAVVTGSEGLPGKPDPAPYLAGAKRLEAEPEQCLAFEDSPAGLAAARASGAHVVDVKTTPVVQLAALL